MKRGGARTLRAPGSQGTTSGMARSIAVIMLCALLVSICGCSGARPRGAALDEEQASAAWEGGHAARTPLSPTTRLPATPTARPCEDGRGHDFGDEVRKLYDLVACIDEARAAASFDPAIVAAHCSAIRGKIRDHQNRFLSLAKPFFAKLTPGSPARVVYPFSGGDLATALTTFPHAQEITTISLELAGDPRVRVGVRGGLAQSLSKVRREAGELLVDERYSRSETLKQTQLGALPGALSMFLLGLAVHGLEPVGLRYFTLRPDGAVHYLSDCDIAALGDHGARRKSTWLPPDFSEAFANAEIRFRRAGEADAPVRVHRHIAANLKDGALSADPSLLSHLAAKGLVSAMTKAASYLLWSDACSMIRTYLLDHASVMVSDSTGIPPDFARAYGLTQETYGAFNGSLLPASAMHNRAFQTLWRSQPRRPLSFRYGYLSGGRPHLVITRRAAEDQTD